MSVEYDKSIFEENRQQLEHLSFLAIKEGLTREEFVMLVVDLEDPSWDDIVDNELTDEDLQEFRDRDEKPLGIGVIYNEYIIDYLCEAVPDIAPALTGNLPKEVVRAVVMADGVASVHFIKPFPYFRDS